MNEIRGLRLKLADLIREQQILRAGVENVELLKKEVHHLGRQVLQERTKVKALSDELENPLNIHRHDRLATFLCPSVVLEPPHFKLENPLNTTGATG